MSGLLGRKGIFVFYVYFYLFHLFRQSFCLKRWQGSGSGSLVGGFWVFWFGLASISLFIFPVE